eukprot:COSAG04_NODE_861_length_9806_cov_5.052127_12_plen_123_part_00
MLQRRGECEQNRPSRSQRQGDVAFDNFGPQQQTAPTDLVVTHPTAATSSYRTGQSGVAAVEAGAHHARAGVGKGSLWMIGLGAVPSLRMGTAAPIPFPPFRARARVFTPACAAGPGSPAAPC